MKIFLRIIDALSKGNPVMIPGHGTCRFNTVHISDALRAYEVALKNKKAVGQAFNIATSDTVTVKQLLREGKRLFHSKSTVWYAYFPLVKVMNRIIWMLGFHLVQPNEIDWINRDMYFDVSKAKKLLGFTTTMSALGAFMDLAKSFLDNQGEIMNRASDDPVLEEN